MAKKLGEMTLEELADFIDMRIEQKLDEILGDPDSGLEVRREIIEQLKAQRASSEKRIPLEQLAKEMGIDLERN